MSLRLAALALAGLTLGACTATVGGLPIRNTPSDLAQCPDLSGAYQAQGEILSRRGAPTAEPDLNALLARPLAVRDLSQAPDVWGDGAPTTITLSQAAGGWRITADNGRGAAAEGRLPLLNGAPDPQPNEPPYAADLLSRTNGCARGRLWIATESVRTQYESYSANSHVGVLTPTPDALLLDLWSERRQIGLLPWTFVDRSLTRYRFARIAAPATLP
ncbi:MAG: hypothetical protein P0Y52_12010 [Candidatus Brevundimonas phytovorans]|nr:hypothetical protein [Brevundimonas sp.]WEK57261.1 MAG: hypothetical protein P0Y52_12010 [Brevundimonas sp.]